MMPSATEWAQQAPSDRAVRWKALEVAAFSDHSSIVRLLDPHREYGRPPMSAAASIALVLAVVPMLALDVALLFPSAVGLVLLWGSLRTSHDHRLGFGLPGAGIAFAVSVVVLLGGIITWVKHGRRSDMIAYKQVVFGVLFGVLSLVTVAAYRVTTYRLWGVWVTPIAVSTLLAVLFGVLLFVAGHSDRHKDDRPAVEPLKPVRLAVEKLPADERAAIRVDINNALDILVARGIISPDDAAWGRTAELGKLALHMSGPRPSHSDT